MSATIERISTYIEKKGISVNALENALGLKNGRIRKPMKDGGDVGCQVLEAFARKFPEVNLRWLLTGEGNMLNVEKNSSIVLIDSQNGQNSTNSVQMNNSTSEDYKSKYEAVLKENEALRMECKQKDGVIARLTKIMAGE